MPLATTANIGIIVAVSLVTVGLVSLGIVEVVNSANDAAIRNVRTGPAGYVRTTGGLRGTLFTEPAVNLSATSDDTVGVLPVDRGGTGSSEFAIPGGLVVSNGLAGTGLFQKALLAGPGIDITGVDGTDVNATAITISVLDVNLETDVTGVLPPPHGGTGVTSVPEGFLLVGGASTSDALVPVELVGGSGILVHRNETAITVTLVDVNLTGSVDLTADVNNVLPVSNGGTGLSSIGQDELLVGDGTGQFVPKVLTAGPGIMVVPTEDSLVVSAENTNLASDVTGVLPVANGGTALSSISSGQILVGNSTNNGFDKKTLVAGTGMTITQAVSTITITRNGINMSSDPVTGQLGVIYGGTGTNGIANGQVLIGNVANSGFDKKILAAGTGMSITSNSTAVIFTRTTINLATDVSNVLPVASGGTGVTSVAGDEFLIGDGLGAFTKKTFVAGSGMAITHGASTVTITRNPVPLDTDTTGILPLANGGTGVSTISNGQILVGNTTGTGFYKKSISGGTGITISQTSSVITVARNTINLATSDVTGVLPVGNGGTGLTAITPDTILSGSAGSVVALRTLNAGYGMTLTTDASSYTFTRNAVDLSTSDVNNTLPVIRGGTGLTTITPNTILSGSATSVVALRTLNAGYGMTLTTDASSYTFSRNAVDLSTSDVNNTLGVANGGTSVSSITNGQILVGNAGGTGFDKKTLVAGTGMTVTQGASTITFTRTTISLTSDVSNVLPNANGGTGYSSYSDLEILVGNSFLGNSLQKRTLTAGDGMSVIDDGANVVVSRTLVDLVNEVSGTLPVSNGGTSFSSIGNGEFLLGNGVGGYTKTTFVAGTGMTITPGSGTLTFTRNAINAATDITGTLLVGHGGTGLTGITPEKVLSGSSGGGMLLRSMVAGYGLTLTTDTSSYTFSRNAVDLSTSDVNNTLPLVRGGTGLTTIANGELLVGNSGGTGFDKKTLVAGTGMTVTQGASTITITRNGINMSSDPASGQLAVIYGGTGTNGIASNQFLVGNAANSGFDKRTLVAGTGITITPATSTMTIATTGLEPTVKMWVFEERYTTTSNTVAGNNIRVLNTAAFSGGSEVTLNTGTGVMTFATGGNYHLSATVPGYGVGTHRSYIYSVTLSGDISYGTTEYAPVGYQTSSRYEAKLVIPTSAQFSLRHRVELASTNGFGYPSTAITGSYGVYATITIVKYNT